MALLAYIKRHKGYVRLEKFHYNRIGIAALAKL